MRPITKFTCTTNTSQMPIKCKAGGLFFVCCVRRHCCRRSCSTHSLSILSTLGIHWCLPICQWEYCFIQFYFDAFNSISKRSLSLDEVNECCFSVILMCCFRTDLVDRWQNCRLTNLFYFVISSKFLDANCIGNQLLLYTLNSLASQKRLKFNSNWEDFGNYFKTFGSKLSQQFLPGIFFLILFTEPNTYTHTHKIIILGKYMIQNSSLEQHNWN